MRYYIDSPYRVKLSQPVKIPISSLQPDTLQRIIEEFICREGTDYGQEEASMKTKIVQVHQQLRDGSANLFFDPNTESCNIIENKP